MESEDKAIAIAAVAALMGVIGGMAIGWPALLCAAISICAIAMSPTPAAVSERDGGSHE